MSSIDPNADELKFDILEQEQLQQEIEQQQIAAQEEIDANQLDDEIKEQNKAPPIDNTYVPPPNANAKEVKLARFNRHHGRHHKV